MLDLSMKRLDGSEQPLEDYKGKVLMLVNVASYCGNTPQYTGLEKLYKTYQEKGFQILGFPANNFGRQEPGTDTEIAQFCSQNYGVTFPMFSKISVKGEDILSLRDNQPNLRADAHRVGRAPLGRAGARLHPAR